MHAETASAAQAAVVLKWGLRIILVSSDSGWARPNVTRLRRMRKQVRRCPPLEAEALLLLEEVLLAHLARGAQLVQPLEQGHLRVIARRGPEVILKRLRGGAQVPAAHGAPLGGGPALLPVPVGEDHHPAALVGRVAPGGPLAPAVPRPPPPHPP